MSDSRPWFRFYTQTLFSGKVQNLDGNSFKTLINLWCCFAHHGCKLPEIPALAFELRIRESSLRKQLEELVALGLIDYNDGTYAPHDWCEWQRESDTSKARTQAYRDRLVTSQNRHGDRHGNVTVTAQDSDTDTDKEKKKKKASRAPSPEPDSDWKTDRSFDRFATAFLQARPNTLDDEFPAAHERWRTMPIAEQAKAVHGIQERIDGQVWTDPNFVMAPAKYLASEYKRIVIPRSNGKPTQPAEKKIPTYDELHAKGLV